MYKLSINRWELVILGCLTLGLAPFSPEPHIWQKSKWLVSGANGMGAIDYFDLLFHAFPWILLLRLMYLSIQPKKEEVQDHQEHLIK